MNPLKYIALVVLLVAAACNQVDSNNALPDITLEPTQIVANLRPSPQPSPTRAAPDPVLLARGATGESDTATPPETTTIETDIEPSATPAIEPTPMPTSNAPELQALLENPTLLLTTEMEATCFLAGDFIPFRLVVRSLETANIYFYKNGRWLFSINNSPPGPQLTSREPTLRDEFVDLPPNEIYIQDEEDLGLWVLSLGPSAGDLVSPTGLGLPAGDYWVTFLYNNDQDGLREQFGGTYLIEKAAWRGTVVAPEVRFRVVNDLSEC